MHAKCRPALYVTVSIGVELAVIGIGARVTLDFTLCLVPKLQSTV